MTFRQEAGLQLAKSGKCKAQKKVVSVPSRSKPGAIYLVNLKFAQPRCGCKDNVVNAQICAHIWAARFVLEWESPAEAVNTESKSKPKRASFPREWALYNRAEVSAARLAREMLAYLAQNLIELSHEAVERV
jgi:hypothetical protein